VSVAGPLVIGGTNQAYSPLVRLLFDDQIADTAPIMVNENGQLWLNGHDDTLGPLTLAQRAVVSTGIGGGSSSPGLLTLNGNVTNLTSGCQYEARIDGRLDLGLFTRTFHVGCNLRVGADVSGGGIFNPGITKTGSGNLHLIGETNSYAGITLVQQGRLTLAGCTPGTTNAGTTVAAGARLSLFQAEIGNESLVLNGQTNLATLEFDRTNTWAGPVTLNGPCYVFDFSGPGDPDRHLTFSGVISGSGSLRKAGYGRLHFTGLGGNTFTGGLYCEEGFTYLDKSASAPALSGPLVVGRAGEAGQYIFVEVTQINQIPNNVPIKLIDYGLLSAGAGVTDTLGPIEFAGGVLSGVFTLAGDVTNRVTSIQTAGIYGSVLLSGTRIFHCDTNSTLAVIGALGGTGGISKTGPGELKLLGACSYSGATTVNDGTLRLATNGLPGSTAAGTTVEANGVLYLDGVGVTNESLVLHGGGSDGVALIHHNTNVWSGTVEIHGGAAIMAEPTARLSILGAITGLGGLTHFGDGTLVLGGSGDNDFFGPMTFRLGTLMLSKSGAFFAIPHSLTMGYDTNGAPGALVKCAAANQFAPAYGADLVIGGITLNPNCELDCNGFDQEVANLHLTDAVVKTGAGVLSLGGALTADSSVGDNSYLYGKLRLFTGWVTDHHFYTGTNVELLTTAEISEAANSQSITKTGPGYMSNLGDVNITGKLTVSQGRWYAAGSNPFGSSGGTTEVQSGATLVVYSGTHSEPLQLAGSGDAGLGALYAAGNNESTGPITLSSDAVINTPTNTIVTLSGAISGAGGLTKEGVGTLQLTGSESNSFAGATIVNKGELQLAKTNAVAIPGPLTVNGVSGASQVRLLQPDQIGDLSAVVLSGTGAIFPEGHNETIGSLAGVGAIFQSADQAGLLTVGGNGASTTFGGAIHGRGGLTKTGSGTFSLTQNNPYTGTTTVNGGKLLVFGQQPQSPVSLLTGGMLGGNGRVGHISDLNGHIAPGASPGILVCSNFSTFSPANVLQIEINGTTPGSTYDQLQVNGTVLLMGGTLEVTMNAVGAVSNDYVIISNDGADPVTGTFTGLPEGATLSNNGFTFAVTYHGGDGNDVALIQQNVGFQLQMGGIQKLANGSMQISGTGWPNTKYAVDATESLSSPIQWNEISTMSADGSGQITFTDDDAPNYLIRFYRFRSVD
jgi:autotransporter-associated beta strand protein